jgi:hypothetical protein
MKTEQSNDDMIAGLGRHLERVSPQEIRVKGTRICIEHVLERYLFKGQPLDEIAVELDLTAAQVGAVISYLETNRQEVWCYLADFFEWRRKFESELLAKQRATGLRERLLRRASQRGHRHPLPSR